MTLLKELLLEKCEMIITMRKNMNSFGFRIWALSVLILE